MKRLGNLFEKIISIDNLEKADKIARKGKLHRKEVRRHIQKEGVNREELHDLLLSGEFKTSEYKRFTIFDGKERKICSLPYFPDLVVHHAIINIIGPIFNRVFTVDTYSCIKGRGIHKASYNLRKSLRNVEDTRYCLKLDIRKFYPSVNNEILKELLRKKFKDPRLLDLLDEIIDSSQGLPIGSFISQNLSNFYLTYFDHYVKEVLGVKYYFRYADDIVVLSNDKNWLRDVLTKIREYLITLKLEIKSNWQIFPVSSRGIDWVGYVHYHSHTLLRKRIKKNYIRSSNRGNFNGWLVHANTINLRRKYE